jgi:phage tail sheath protein FI
MPFQVSPGVNVTEYDLTSAIPAPAGTVGAIAGEFEWGPAEIAQPISSELKLVERFGKPPYSSSGNNITDFFTAASFLAYSGSLVVSRAVNSASNNAVAVRNNKVYVAANDGAQVKNSDTYVANPTPTANGVFMARYPGTLGNNLDVSLWANTVNALSDWKFGTYFDRKPATSDWIRSNFGTTTANDELYIAVVDRTGAISGVPNTVLEKFVASKATNAKDQNNNSMYYKDVLLNKSRFIYHVGHPTANLGLITGASDWGVSANATYIFGEHAAGAANVSYSLANGTYVAVTNADVMRAANVFSSPTVDVGLILTGAHASEVVNNAITVAEGRKDCLVFCSPTLANAQSTQPEIDIPARRATYGYSSYAVMDSGWKYMYDKYWDTYRWVPLNGDVAGCAARTDAERQPWFSPAGPARGQIKNLVKLAYNPDKADRDILYKADINPVVSFAGEGTYLYGDKTLLGRVSAFDRINVRRLFMILEKAIARAAKASLFEFNDEFTRSQFVSLVDPYLRSVMAGRGIYDYRVICDERNNPPDLIDRNEFVGDIYIKPAKSVNFIQLNFVAMRTGVQFEEVIGRATV